MEKFIDVISVLLSMPYDFWFAILLMLCGIYFILIAPLIFWFWVIPKIENRYQTTLRLDSSVYMSICPSWGVPAFEISAYIFCKFVGWEWVRGVRNPQPGRLLSALKKINYDINAASKVEIAMSFISVFFFVCLIVSGIVVAIGTAGK